MRKTGIFLLSVIFITITMVGYAESKILQNPGFENEDRLRYWATDGNATFVWIEQWQPAEGKWSFGVGNDLDWAKESSWGRCIQVLRNPSDPSKLYPISEGNVIQFTMKMMGEDGYAGKASLKVEFFSYDRREGFSAAPLSSFQSKIYTDRFSWIKATVRGIAPKGTVSAAVSCVSENMSKGSKYIWFDDGGVSISTVR